MATQLGTAVRIHVKPRLQQLSESRSVLDALKKFGEVNTFKNLKFDYHRLKPTADNRCIRVIFEDKEAAERAIAASPLKVSISQTQPQPQPANNPSSTEFPFSKTKSDPVLSSFTSNPDNTPTNQEITCTIESDFDEWAINTSRTKFNAYSASNQYNHILNDLKGPETNIPLPQLADKIQHEGAKLYIEKRQPHPNAPTLMQFYREGVQAAADKKNRRPEVVTLEETHDSHQHQATARESELKQLARKKTHRVQTMED